MRAKGIFLISGFLIASLSLLIPSPSKETKRTASKGLEVRQAQASVLSTYGKLPLAFEVNRGQSDARVKFLSHSRGYTLFLTPTEAVLALGAPAKPKPSGKYFEPLPPGLARLGFPEALTVNGQRSLLERAMTSAEPAALSVLRIKLVGANPKPNVEGIDLLPGKSNYFIGNDPKKWRTNVANYAQVEYGEIYPGVDLLYYCNQRQLEHDFVVAPGADPRTITLGLEGADKVSIAADGDLVLDTDAGEVRLQKPLVYQEAASGRQEIAGWYRLKNTNQISFDVAAYDSTRPLVIDPVLVYSTYLGGGDFDVAFGVAVDSPGNAYVTGITCSSNFPTASPFQAAPGGGCDAFVTKLNPAGSGLVYSTYLGGSDYDQGNGIAVDSAGNAYVAGSTTSINFPTTTGGFQQTYGGGSRDAFVAKLNPAGSALVYSTYLGGSDGDGGQGIAVDAAGNAYVAGRTLSTNFPTTLGAFQTTIGGASDAFVTKLNPLGTGLVYSTYLGGSGDEFTSGGGIRIAVDPPGNAYVTGATSSTNFPTTPGAFQTTFGGISDAFVTKLNSAGSALVYSTYLGGSAAENGRGIAADAVGNAYVTGYTDSTNFPTLNPIQAANGGGSDVIVAKFGPGGTLIYSTYLGGNGPNDGAFGITADSSGSAYVVGETNSTDFPTTTGGFQQTYAGGSRDVFVAKIVEPPSELISDLRNLVASFNLPKGISTDLDAKLRAVQADVAAGNLTAACNTINAFISAATAQSGKMLTAAQVNQLIAAANQIKAALGCP